VAFITPRMLFLPSEAFPSKEYKESIETGEKTVNR
jgi:hypothetical protein